LASFILPGVRSSAKPLWFADPWSTQEVGVVKFCASGANVLWKQPDIYSFWIAGSVQLGNSRVE
jgi:hypothetical protein